MCVMTRLIWCAAVLLAVNSKGQSAPEPERPHEEGQFEQYRNQTTVAENTLKADSRFSSSSPEVHITGVSVQIGDTHTYNVTMDVKTSGATKAEQSCSVVVHEQGGQWTAMPVANGTVSCVPASKEEIEKHNYGSR